MVTLTTTEIMDVFDVGSSGTLSKWKDLGAKEAYKGRNQWDLKAFLDWFLQNIHARFDAETFKDERLRYEKARADKIELEVALMKGKVKPIEDIEKEWAARAALVVNGLNIYRDRLPPLLEGKSRNKMRGIINKENNRLRNYYCEQGEYTAKVEIDEER